MRDAVQQRLIEQTEAAELGVYARLELVLERGQGCWVFDRRGRRYLDLYGGHAVALTGHCHPEVVAAIQRQARRLLFYSSSVYCPVRAEASRLLAERGPWPGGGRVFHCCSGSEANEVALKLARKLTGRRRVISFEGSFHGRTLAALSACGLAGYRATAGPVLVPDHEQVPFGDAEALEAALDEQTAAVLLEPIQSLAGVRLAPEGWYARVAAAARRAGALLIFDEVQTGLGRTGSFLFCEAVGVKPDLITLAKGLASGLPAAAVLVAPELAAEVRRGDHGSTFGGGPLAMAALVATLEVIAREDLAGNAARQGERLRAALAGLPGVVAVRGRGLLLGVELERPASEVQAGLLARGILCGTAADPRVLRLLPPLVLGEAEVEHFVQALEDLLGATDVLRPEGRP